MARSSLTKKKKKKKRRAISFDVPVVNDNKVPIPNMPDKFLWMKVKSGTKIRNVLDYSLTEFSSHKCVVWSGAGQGIGKVISCVEIFKRKLTGLYQITKLGYIQSKSKEKNEKDNRRVAEIHILLSKDALDINESGYQAPEACAMFQESDKSNEHRNVQNGKARMSNPTAEEFAAMGLRTGQKRPRPDNKADTPTTTTTTKKKKQCGGN